MVSIDIQQSEWDEFVEAHKDASGYHLWRWRDILGSTFGHECVYLAHREAGRVTGVLPFVVVRSWLFGRFAVSLPFVNYGGILASNQRAVDALVDAAGALARERGLTHIEFRHQRRLCPTLPVRQHKVAMRLPLARSPGDMWNALDRKVRNQVRKAEKSGLDLQVGGLKILPEFYGVFARNMRDLGTPVYSSAFFAAILQQFPESTWVFAVRQGRQTIGAAIAYAFRDGIEVPWASSLKEYLPLCPNNLLYWSIIQHAIAHSLRALDFGRSTPDKGTFHFKRQWGAEASPLHWEYQLLSRTTVPDQGPSNPRFRMAIEAWKRLPLGVANRLGPPIVRGIP